MHDAHMGLVVQEGGRQQVLRRWGDPAGVCVSAAATMTAPPRLPNPLLLACCSLATDTSASDGRAH